MRRQGDHYYLMPICPGCDQPVPYDRLRVHEQYCVELRRSVSATTSKESFDGRLASFEERVDRRLSGVESELERRLRQLEAVQRTLDETAETDS